MGTDIAIRIGLLSVLAFAPQLGNFYGKASIEQNINRLRTHSLTTIQLFQTPPPPCDPVNDPSSCRSS